MEIKEPIKAFGLAVTVAMAGIGVTGCEWDNSEDYYQDSDGDPGTKEPDDEDQSNPEAVVSGLIATSEPIASALVCIDVNDNGVCELEESQTKSNSRGEWSIKLNSDEPLLLTSNVLVETDAPYTELADSGTQVPWSYSFAVRVSPTGAAVTDVFASPLSSLVENERVNLSYGGQDIAIRNIASLIRADVDILENYLTPPTDGGPLDESGFDRLSRIASVANELAIDIDANIPQGERSNLTKKEIDNRIWKQVRNALGQIADDIDLTMIDQPDDEDFDPVVIVDQPKYDEEREAPSTEPSSPSMTELERRIANAKNTSPYFTLSGFETYPVNGSRLLAFEFIDNPLRPEQIYYETRRRFVADTNGDQAMMDIDIAVPSRTELDQELTTYQVIDETMCQDYRFDCDSLRAQPRTTDALTWTGFSFVAKTIEIGHVGRQRTLVIDGLGDLIASSDRNGFATEMNFREFSLDGLDGREVVEFVTEKELPESGSWTFGTGAKAYTFAESLVGDVVLSQWPGGGDGNLCDSPGLPDASETMSCNLVYGAIGRSTGMPAETFGEALYPTGLMGATYNGVLENGEPADAMRLTGPNDDVYVARMYGSASDDSGPIVIDRQTDTGWETLGVTGQWQKNNVPFPRIELYLPNGLTYEDARIGFKLGRAYLYERQGYLRHGWSIHEEINLDSLFNRRQVKYVFNQEAFDQMIAGLETNSILVEHPYYSEILDDMAAEEENGTGGGGQTE